MCPTRLSFGAVRVVAVVPTFNEADNIEMLFGALRTVVPSIEIVVVDDGSPDGTAERARKLGETLGGISVIERGHKSGLGTAYRSRAAGGDRDGCRHLRADRRRPVARPGGVARPRRQHRARRRPRDRQPVRTRWPDPELAVAAALAVAVGQPLRRRRARAGGQRRHGRLSRLPQHGAVADGLRVGAEPRATASRSR